MMKILFIIWLLIALSAAGFCQSSENYTLQKFEIGKTRTAVSSENYRMNVRFGHQFQGEVSSPMYSMKPEPDIFPPDAPTGYDYLPGDVNMYNAVWPPQSIGGDVTYLVNYFRSIETSIACFLDGFWCSADANGDCNIIGSDVTRLVNYFRGQADLLYCPEYEPAWPTPDYLPGEAPPGWPNCE